MADLLGRRTFRSVDCRRLSGVRRDSAEGQLAATAAIIISSGSYGCGSSSSSGNVDGCYSYSSGSCNSSSSSSADSSGIGLWAA